jgi:hypothetical protein
MDKETIEGASIALSAMKFVRDLLKDSIGLKKKDKAKIQKAAEHIIELATVEDVDRYVAEPRRIKIDYMTGAAETTHRRGRPPAHVARKAAPKMAAKARRAVHKKSAKKKR